MSQQIFEGMIEEPFEKHIKEYRLYCWKNKDRISFNLLDILQNAYYEVQYQQHKLPTSFQKYLHSLEDLFVYIRDKTKIFKILGPGIVMCAQYMGRVQKYILLEMTKMEPNQALFQNNYVLMLQRNCRQLLNKVNYLQAQLSLKQNTRKVQSLAKKVKNKRMAKKLKREDKVSRCEQMDAELKQIYPPIVQQPEPPQCQQIHFFHPEEQQISVKHNDEKINKVDFHRISLEINKENPFYSRFDIRQNIVKKVNSSEPFPLFSKSSIKGWNKSSFSMKIAKSKYGSICVGLASLQYFKVDGRERQNHLISYNGYYGAITNESIESKRNLVKLKEGDFIKVTVDLDQRQIVWIINNEKAGTANISQTLLKEELFPYLQMEDKNDVIILNVE